MKHLLLLPSLLLLTTVAVAQLYVAPNTSGTPSDSYIYVNDEILYVEQDVNLVENVVDPDTNASIYLRNDGQLIQGSNVNNAGSGYLSVLRDNPDSDAWDYTFYASPVGDNFSAPAAGPGNINFGIMSLHTPTYNPLATDYSAPLSATAADQTQITGAREGNFDTAANELTISTRWTYTRDSGHESAWERIYANNLTPAGRGFIMKGVNRDGAPSTHDFVYDFRGRPNNGTINLTVAPLNGPHPQSLTNEVFQEILTGNPYPSALDLNRLFYDTSSTDLTGTNNNSEIESVLYWDEDRSVNSHLYTDNKGGFGIWTPGPSDPNGTNQGNYVRPVFLNYEPGGIPISATSGMGPAIDRRFAPVGQGFYFRTRNTQLGDLTAFQVSIKNQYRRYIKESSGDSTFRMAGTENNTPFQSHTPIPTEPNELVFPQMRIYTYFNESHFRDMLLVFSNQATDFYDWGWDGYHQMDAVGAEAYFPVDVNGDGETIEEFVIQALPFDAAKTIPYAIVLANQTEVVVQAVDEVNIPGTAYIWDSEEDTYQEISDNRTASFNLPAGTYDNRFFIVFTNGDEPYISHEGSTGRNAMSNRASDTYIKEVKTNVRFFQNNTLGQLEIGNPEGYDIEFAHMFDMSGKLVATRTDIGNSRNYNIGTASLADGVYLVKLVTSENINIDYKAIVANKR